MNALGAALGHTSAGVRISAAGLLGTQKDPAAVPDLVWMLENDKEPAVRIASSEALGMIGNKLATGPLMRALRQPDAALRRGAAAALGKLADPKAIAALKPLVEDEDPETAAAARIALQQLEKR